MMYILIQYIYLHSYVFNDKVPCLNAFITKQKPENFKFQTKDS